MITVQRFTFNPFSENTYILYNEQKNALLIDPGNVHEHETEILHQLITDHEFTIKNILLTHAHIDHVLGLQWAHDTFRVPVYMHLEDKEILDKNPTTAKQFGFNFLPFVGEIQYLSEKDTLLLDEDELHIYHVPGHSPGSIVFHHKIQNFIISGDVLFQGSIGRTDLYKGNHEQLIDGIRKKLFVLDDHTEVYCGHGNPTQIGYERKFNPFF